MVVRLPKNPETIPEGKISFRMDIFSKIRVKIVIGGARKPGVYYHHQSNKTGRIQASIIVKIRPPKNNRIVQLAAIIGQNSFNTDHALRV